MTRAIALMTIVALVPFSIDLSCRDKPTPPVVNADCGTGTAIVDEPVTLSGYVVADTGCPPFNYNWAQLTGPPGILEQASPNDDAATFTPLYQGVYILRLTVTDDCGNHDFDDCVVNVPSGEPDGCEFIDPVTGEVMEPSGNGFEECCAVECEQVSHQNTVMLKVYRCTPPPEEQAKIDIDGCCGYLDPCPSTTHYPVANVRVDWFLERIYGGILGEPPELDDGWQWPEPPCDKIVGEIVMADDDNGDSSQRDEDFATTYTDDDGTTWIVIHSRYEGITPVTAVVFDENGEELTKCCFVKIWTCLEVVCVEAASEPVINNVNTGSGQELENWHQFTFQVNNICTGTVECGVPITIYWDGTGPDAYLERPNETFADEFEACDTTYTMADPGDPCAVLQNTMVDMGTFPTDIRTLTSFTALTDQNGQVPVRIRLAPTAESITDGLNLITCVQTDDVDLGAADCECGIPDINDCPTPEATPVFSRVCGSLSVDCLPVTGEVDCLTDCCEKGWVCVPALQVLKVDGLDPFPYEDLDPSGFGVQYLIEIENEGTCDLTGMAIREVIDTAGLFDPLPADFVASIGNYVRFIPEVSFNAARDSDQQGRLNLTEPLLPTQSLVLIFTPPVQGTVPAGSYDVHVNAVNVNAEQFCPEDESQDDEQTTVTNGFDFPVPGLEFTNLPGTGFYEINQGGAATSVTVTILRATQALTNVVVTVQVDERLTVSNEAAGNENGGGSAVQAPLGDNVITLFIPALPAQGGGLDETLTFDLGNTAPTPLVDSGVLITGIARSDQGGLSRTEVAVPVLIDVP